MFLDFIPVHYPGFWWIYEISGNKDTGNTKKIQRAEPNGDAETFHDPEVHWLLRIVLLTANFIAEGFGVILRVTGCIVHCVKSTKNCCKTERYLLGV